MAFIFHKKPILYSAKNAYIVKSVLISTQHQEETKIEDIMEELEKQIDAKKQTMNNTCLETQPITEYQLDRDKEQIVLRQRLE
ncbi:hypothetical protein Aduo_012951 [Ancylostoma duodenale]